MHGATPLSQMALTANSNISPKRFITLDSTLFGAANQASNQNQILLGVSLDFTRYPPNSPADDGFIAIAGEELPYAGPFQRTLLTLGATPVTDPRIPLTTDVNGKGVPAAPTVGTVIYYGAMPIVAGAAGDDIPVWVMPITITD